MGFDSNLPPLGKRAIDRRRKLLKLLWSSISLMGLFLLWNGVFPTSDDNTFFFGAYLLFGVYGLLWIMGCFVLFLIPAWKLDYIDSDKLFLLERTCSSSPVAWACLSKIKAEGRHPTFAENQALLELFRIS